VKVEPAQVPTIFTVGDSMVADHPTEPTGSWAQFLPAMLDDGIAVANYAESGATLKSFLADLRLDKALSLMKPGDVLMIQFGHNDQKANWPQTYAEAGTTYRAYLAAYIAEARRRGASPVLVTSPERRNFDAQGHIVPSLGDYPRVMRELAKEQNIPLVDLNRASVIFMRLWGRNARPPCSTTKAATRPITTIGAHGWPRASWPISCAVPCPLWHRISPRRLRSGASRAGRYRAQRRAFQPTPARQLTTKNRRELPRRHSSTQGA
jgi:lysophospholipase L1-like esterase